MRKAVFVKMLDVRPENVSPGSYDQFMEGDDGWEYSFRNEVDPDFLREHCSPGSLVVLRSTRQFSPHLKHNRDMDRERFRIWEVVLPEQDGELQSIQN